MIRDPTKQYAEKTPLTIDYFHKYRNIRYLVINQINLIPCIKELGYHLTSQKRVVFFLPRYNVGPRAARFGFSKYLGR